MSPSLNFLFLCTAHNSLSQRLSLVLQENGHNVTVELAISNEIMVEAAQLAKPDLILCPFLTKKVPVEIYEKYLTLIVHPGPPGDAGPSAIDWVLLGDDGVEPNPKSALEKISTNDYVAHGQGRTHWGVTVLQAIEEFDAGPVWAWDQFPIELDGPHAPTKASLYRGPVTKAAIASCLTAIDRILELAPNTQNITTTLAVDPNWKQFSVTTKQPFQGGITRTRPLLKPSERGWDPAQHSAAYASRRLRASDSQPGVQSSLFGRNLYMYGGIIEENDIPFAKYEPGKVVAKRHGAVLVSTADGRGVWVTHVRRLKAKMETLLPAKLPAVQGLEFLKDLKLDETPEWRLDGFERKTGTLQEIWIEYVYHGSVKTAYIYSDFYNGAASTDQCRRLLAAMKIAIESGIGALVLMGGSYFSNGIHLGVCSTDIATESWKDINAINDCVKLTLEQNNIITFAAIRGNVAAGGFAVATCCDFVLAVENAVINPHYRAVSLYGSEYHSLTWYARIGEEQAKAMMRGMLPMSAQTALTAGLVDCIIPSEESIPSLVASRLASKDVSCPYRGAPWVRDLDDGEDLIQAAAASKVAWFSRLPQPIEQYRVQELDFMKLCFTDPRYQACVKAFVGKAAPSQTPLRFALHRRFQHWNHISMDTEEALDYFQYPSIDPAEVNNQLGLDAETPIKPCLPPPLAWMPLKTPSVTSMSPSTSGSAGLVSLCDTRSASSAEVASPGEPGLSTEDTEPERSAGKTTFVPLPPSSNGKSIGNRIKKIFVRREHLPEKTSALDGTTSTPAVDGKAAVQGHQMACYYSAQE